MSENSLFACDLALLATLMKDIIVALGSIIFFALTLSLRRLPESLP